MTRRLSDTRERGYPSKNYSPAAQLYPLLALTDEEKESYLDYKSTEVKAQRGCASAQERIRLFKQAYYKAYVKIRKEKVLELKRGEKKAMIEKIEALRKYIRFSPREIEVLSLYLEGRNDAEITQKLHISNEALSQYRSFICGKFRAYVLLPVGARVNKMPKIIEFVKNYDGGELVRIEKPVSVAENPPISSNYEQCGNAGDITDAVRRARKKFIDEYNEKLRTLGRAVYENNQLGVNLCKEQVRDADAKMKALEGVEKELLKIEG